ncbi:hypothetical protein Aduo_000115 [Ancylostoma duodenale]
MVNQYDNWNNQKWQRFPLRKKLELTVRNDVVRGGGDDVDEGKCGQEKKPNDENPHVPPDVKPSFVERTTSTHSSEIDYYTITGAPQNCSENYGENQRVVRFIHMLRGTELLDDMGLSGRISQKPLEVIATHGDM